jgi:hypothetical protein
MKLRRERRERSRAEDVARTLKLFHVTLGLPMTPYMAPAADSAPGEPGGERHVLEGSVAREPRAEHLSALR